MSYKNAYNDPRHVDPRSRGGNVFSDGYRHADPPGPPQRSTNEAGRGRGRGRGKGGFDRGRGHARGRGSTSFGQGGPNRYESSIHSSPRSTLTEPRPTAEPPKIQKPLESPNSPQIVQNILGISNDTPSMVSVVSSYSQIRPMPPSSPPNFNALSSLDKLLQFSETVAVADPHADSGFEPFNLASMAEDFLNKQMTVNAPFEPKVSAGPKVSVGLQAKAPKTAIAMSYGGVKVVSPPPTPALPVSPKTRAAELRELLRKKKKTGPPQEEEPIKQTSTALAAPVPSVKRLASPQKRPRDPSDDAPPAKHIASRTRRVSSPQKETQQIAPVETLNRPVIESAPRVIEYRSPIQSTSPGRDRRGLSLTEQSMAYTHRSSRSPMRYESYGGSRFGESSRYSQLSNVGHQHPRSFADTRESDATTVGVRGSTASLLGRMTLDPATTARPLDNGFHETVKSEDRRRGSFRQEANVSPSMAYREARPGPIYHSKGQYESGPTKSIPQTWEEEYGRGNFPAAAPERAPLHPQPSPLNTDPQVASVTTQLSPAVAQSIMETLVSLKAQIAKLEAQLAPATAGRYLPQISQARQAEIQSRPVPQEVRSNSPARYVVSNPRSEPYRGRWYSPPRYGRSPIPEQRGAIPRYDERYAYSPASIVRRTPSPVYMLSPDRDYGTFRRLPPRGASPSPEAYTDRGHDQVSEDGYDLPDARPPWQDREGASGSKKSTRPFARRGRGRGRGASRGGRGGRGRGRG